MKPDWDSLGAEFKDSKTVVIGDVDCTADGKSLCEKYGVRGYPTIKYFNPPDEEGEDYKGGRTLADLKKFAESELGPGCSVDAMENCSDAQKAELETYIAMPAADREAQLTALKTELSEAEKKHEALLKELQSTYKSSMEGVEKLKEASAPKIKLLKAATPSAKPAADTAKDEM
jgi:protein disulfide-isomerase A6